ncbi:MAG: hypothetical protein WDN04_00350 [Rhodospirillales bacterium]
MARSAAIFVDVSKAGDTLGFVATRGTYSIYAYPNGGGIASATKVVGIGSAGEVVGTHLDPAGLPHGFVYSGGTYFNIDAPSATQTLVTGVKRERLAGRLLFRRSGRGGLHRTMSGRTEAVYAMRRCVRFGVAEFC